MGRSRWFSLDYPLTTVASNLQIASRLEPRYSEKLDGRTLTPIQVFMVQTFRIARLQPQGLCRLYATVIFGSVKVNHVDQPSARCRHSKRAEDVSKTLGIIYDST